jgi:hypothetical protein
MASERRAQPGAQQAGRRIGRESRRCREQQTGEKKQAPDHGKKSGGGTAASLSPIYNRGYD